MSLTIIVLLVAKRRTFAQDWDSISIKMLNKAPSRKPVLSHYPPSHTADFDKMAKMPGARLCGPVFATSDLETQIIRECVGREVEISVSSHTDILSFILK